jgi:hypothetical protein
LLLTANFVLFQRNCKTRCQRRVISSPICNRKSAEKAGKQSSLLGDGDRFIQQIRISKEALLIYKDILLGENIYGNQVLKDMAGELFHYKVTAYDSRTKKIAVAHKNRMIERDGSSWEHQDDNHDVIGGLGLELI